MFDRIARRYDLLNRLISFGVDQRWRRATVAALAKSPGALDGAEVLDLATGTADLAIQIARSYPRAHVVGVDPSVNMMQVGATKLQAAGLQARVQLIEGDAQALPFDAQRFTAVSMAFGIRNVPDRSRALREMRRVTRSGGRIAILELAEPKRGPMAAAARFHMHWLVPRLGALLSGAQEYRYLPQSIAAFPPPAAFEEMVERAGLSVKNSVSLTFGVCHLFVAEVP
jgi:demethylmenaquinone methyltransferase / 2-methoxy-6-polyprenyl-1,4-benzoquinol methylase